ncbi:MAG: SPOR domain-containing protein [Deltaproteobacteria bacterium]|nr:SPOR domain-containing protein [Deltaproteobacteria bacterium]
MNTLRNFIVIFLLGAAIFLAGVLLGKTLSDLEHERRAARAEVHPVPVPARTTVVPAGELPPRATGGQEKKPAVAALPPAVEPLAAAGTAKSAAKPGPPTTAVKEKQVKLTFYDTLTDNRSAAAAGSLKKAAARRPAPEKPAAKKVKPPAAKPSATKPSADKPAVKGGVSLQVGSFPQEGQARLFRNRLAGKGYGKLVVVPAAIPGKGTWYRVRIVGLANRQDAEQVRQRLLRREKIKAFLVK